MGIRITCNCKNELDNRPQSNDPKYWKEWTENTHSINWGDVSKDWTRVMDERQDIQNISPEIIDP